MSSFPAYIIHVYCCECTIIVTFSLYVIYISSYFVTACVFTCNLWIYTYRWVLLKHYCLLLAVCFFTRTWRWLYSPTWPLYTEFTLRLWIVPSVIPLTYNWTWLAYWRSLNFDICSQQCWNLWFFSFKVLVNVLHITNWWSRSCCSKGYALQTPCFMLTIVIIMAS